MSASWSSCHTIDIDLAAPLAIVGRLAAVLNLGGDRAADCAPALLRAYPCLRRPPHRQRPSQMEALRCLKRYFAREIYQTLRAELAATAPALRGNPWGDVLRRFNQIGAAAEESAERDREQKGDSNIAVP